MKFVCPVCGYVYEGDSAPEKCPQCGVPGSKFTVVEETGKLVFADEHKIGVARSRVFPRRSLRVCALTSPASAPK